MTSPQPPKLPPMTALEFAIANTFRHFFFGLRCAVLWLIVLLPFLAWAYYAGFRNGPPDFKALSPAATAAFAVLAVMVFLATVSIAVNWHRRLILDEAPKRLAWLRLNGVVWRYLFGFLLIVVVLGMVAGAIFAVLTRAVPALEPQLAAGAKPAGNVVAAILGLFGLFTWYRLSTRLPAIATGDKDYTLGKAWRATRNNRLRFLGFTFWLLFSLAIAGGIAAGAFFAQKALNNPYATGAAFGLIGLLVWLALFLITTISASHYVHFAGKTKSDGSSA
jgi:hypothetical protein